MQGVYLGKQVPIRFEKASEQLIYEQRVREVGPFVVLLGVLGGPPHFRGWPAVQCGKAVSRFRCYPSRCGG